MSLSELTRGLRDDHRRHGGTWRNTALWAVGVYRFGNWASRVSPAPARAVLSKAYGALFFGVELTTGIVLNREAKIGEGFVLLRSGNVKIHPRSMIGDRVRIGHDVTLGTNMERRGAPVIGNDVTIGSGSKILGPIVVGDGATILPNTLVVSDVPAGATVVGVPGRVTKIEAREKPAPAGAVHASPAPLSTRVSSAPGGSAPGGSAPGGPAPGGPAPGGPTPASPAPASPAPASSRTPEIRAHG